MKQFFSFISKEAKHILRDRRTMMILFLMPVVLMLLFGFAISTDIRNVRVIVVSSTMDKQTQSVVDRLNNSEYFMVEHLVGTPLEAERLMRDQQADIAIVFSRSFANNPVNHEIQFITDATDPNTSVMLTTYARQVIMNSAITPVNTRMLYNPQMKSAYNFVPGIMGMLLLLICAMMTSVSIAKEKERGTMEVLLVSPMRPIVIIIAKAVPYMVLSLVILVVVLLMSRYVLDVPLAGNVTAILLVSLLYIFLALSIGLLISVLANSQLVAMLVSGMMLLLPCIMLSGMIYPVESMPQILQWVSVIVPARWFISAIKKLMIMGVPWQMAAREIEVMLLMTAVILVVALKKFKTRLE